MYYPLLALQVQLAASHRNVLIVSTDPAHNLRFVSKELLASLQRAHMSFWLPNNEAAAVHSICVICSDAFGQKFTRKPTLVTGFTNLYCMELDPTSELEETSDLMDGAGDPVSVTRTQVGILL